ncbi:MAG: FtsX-like permease family protein, partial [Candidatus Electrothrix sp. AR4]|nr:FtsX-like permease family protein [Candidatus Electrothrix sp. AR4]
LTLLTRQKELELLRLVGATDNYIRVPFFLEGAILGLLGSASGYYFFGLVLVYFGVGMKCRWFFGHNN